MSIRISAIICTYNRSAYLKKAVQSLLDQTLPQEQYEVIVVDNGSTDNTKAIVEGFKQVFILIRVENGRVKHCHVIYVSTLADAVLRFCPK